MPVRASALGESPVAKVLQVGSIVGLANHTLLLRRDGSEIPIDDSGAPIRDRNNRTPASLNHARKINA
jgi:hypothetical protein